MQIITHSQQAHMDDFLACCILLSKGGAWARVERLPAPLQEHLDDPECYVVDFGKRYEPEKRNFDHHQISGGAVCAFTQILEYFGMRDYDALPWIKYVETWDHAGPHEATKLIGANEAAKKLLYNPVIECVISMFSKIKTIEYGDPLYDLMVSIGNTIIDSYNNYSTTLADLNANAKVIEFEDIKVADYTDCDIASGLNRSVTGEAAWQKANGETHVIFTKDNRTGNGCFRLVQRDKTFDFNGARDISDANITFIHQSGFLCVFANKESMRDIVFAARKFGLDKKSLQTD